MDIRDIRKLYSISSVLGVSKRLIICPLPMHVHSENTPSFSIFNKDGVEYFKCHGNCQRMGDVIDLVGYINIPYYDDKNVVHIMMAISMLVDGHEATLYKPPKRVELLPTKYLDYLPISEAATEYLVKRGFRLSTISNYKVGSKSGAVAIPNFENKVLIGIKFRSTSMSGPRYWSEKGSRGGLFNHDGVFMREDPILVLKAEIPAMLATQVGFTACGLTGGEMSDLSAYRHVFAFSKRVVYVTDNDRDQDVRERVVEYGRRNAKAIRAVLKSPPEQFKDWDEWLSADHAGCVDTTRRWLHED